MSESTPSNTASSAPPTRTPGMWRFFVYSAVGIFAFFVTFTVSGNDSILLDHIVTAIKRAIPDLLPYLVILACVVGSVMPFFDGTWRASTVNKIFTVFKFLGLVLAIMLVARVGPEFLFQKNFGPFLMNSLAVNVGLLVPIGAVFLGFLLGVWVARVRRSARRRLHEARIPHPGPFGHRRRRLVHRQLFALVAHHQPNLQRGRLHGA